MEQRGGCCIARYAGGAHDMSKVDRIMLRFRPIAPKPASANGSLSGGGSGASTEVKNGGISAGTGRGKRKRASKDGKRKFSKGKTNSGGSVTGGEKAVITLPLLPESPEVKESVKIAAKQSRRRPLWLSFGKGGEIEAPPAAERGVLTDPASVMERCVVVWSWVKVECVTDTCVVGCYAYGNLGRTDEERMRSLDGDTCPGFVSDGLNRVRWMNAEYRRMVGGGEAAVVGEVVAWVVIEEGVVLPSSSTAAFTCRVKVVTWEGEKRCKTVPCDVWRMDCGGFAWRLDTKAALSLAL